MPGIKNVNLFTVKSGLPREVKDIDDEDNDNRQYCQSCLR
jgi:hypothetical protein